MALANKDPNAAHGEKDCHPTDAPADVENLALAFCEALKEDLVELGVVASCRDLSAALKEFDALSPWVEPSRQKVTIVVGGPAALAKLRSDANIAQLLPPEVVVHGAAIGSLQQLDATIEDAITVARRSPTAPLLWIFWTLSEGSVGSHYSESGLRNLANKTRILNWRSVQSASSNSVLLLALLEVL